MTFPSIVPTPAQSNCDKLLKGLRGPDLESLILLCGRKSSLRGLLLLLFPLAIESWEKQIGLQIPSSQTGEEWSRTAPPPCAHPAGPSRRMGWG